MAALRLKTSHGEEQVNLKLLMTEKYRHHFQTVVHPDPGVSQISAKHHTWDHWRSLQPFLTTLSTVWFIGAVWFIGVVCTLSKLHIWFSIWILSHGLGIRIDTSGNLFIPPSQIPATAKTWCRATNQWRRKETGKDGNSRCPIHF